MDFKLPRHLLFPLGYSLGIDLAKYFGGQAGHGDLIFAHGFCPISNWEERARWWWWLMQFLACQRMCPYKWPLEICIPKPE